MQHYHESKAKLIDNLQVHTAMNRFLPIKQSAAFLVRVYTYSSRNFEKGKLANDSMANLKVHYSSDACLWIMRILRRKPT